MTVAKSNLLYAMEAQIETSYLNPVTYTPATDGVLLMEPVIVDPKYIFDGARPGAAGTAGAQPNAAPSGRYGELEIKVEMRGHDTAYSASEAPRDLDVLLRASGFQRTFATPDQEYDLESSGFESCALRLFGEGQQYDLTGVYSDWRYDIDGPGFGVFTFNVGGVMVALPSDAGLPGALAYLPSSLLPPKAESLALTLNSVSSFKVRKLALIGGRNIAQRPDLNASTAFAGYAAGRRDVMMEVTVEAEALSTFNPYSLADAATSFAASFTHGSAALNNMDFSAPQAQIVNVEVEHDDPVALWNLTLKCPVSGQTADDELKLTFGG